MGRQTNRYPLRSQQSGSNGVKGGRVQKQRKKNKVVLESAGNKDDDNLRVTLSFRAEPPPGYTFIPAGNTQLTAAMKTFAKRDGKQIMAVSATPHAQRHELSREVHRIGYHFPTEVVAQVCSHYGIRLDSAGRLIGEQDSEKLFMKISQKGQVVLNENIRDQVTINTEAKEIIRDLFPKIPDNDLFSIIKTAFQLGDNKVGTAEEIPLVRRAQLSVVAHIRHSYTNYDKLLRQLPYNEARHTVEQPTLKKLIEWRGNENDQTEASRQAVDEAVREVVVLSDEESSESEIEEGQVLENEDLKVEPVRKPPSPPPAQVEQRPVLPEEMSSGEEAPQGYRYLPHTSRRTVVAHQRPEIVHRQQQSRYALWDQVRHEYRTGVARVPLDDLPQSQEELVPRKVVFEPVAPVRYLVDDQQPTQIIQPQPEPASVFRGADGRLYERAPAMVEEPIMPSRRIYTPPNSRTLLYQTTGRRSASPRAHRPYLHQRTPSLNDDGTVVQSIEPPDTAYRSPASRYPVDQNTVMRHANDNAFQSNKRIIDLTSNAVQATERMHIDQSPASSPYPRRALRRAGPDDMEVERYQAQPRRLIELDSQLPTPVSSQRLTQVNAVRERNVEARHARELPQFIDTRDTVPLRYPMPSERHAVYEPVPERIPLDQPSMRGVQAFRDDREEGRFYSAQNYYRDQPPQYVDREVIVLDSPQVERRARPLERGQPAYRTVYLQP